MNKLIWEEHKALEADKELNKEYLEVTINNANRFSFKNRSLLTECETLSCFFCLRYFKPNDIEAWIDIGDTALCPHCGIDTILPGKINKETLTKINEFWFCKKSL